MRKIIFIVACAVSYYGFSQGAIETKDSLSNPWRIRMDLRSNQILTRISKPIKGYKYDLETRISLRLNRVEIYEGIIFDLNKNIRIIPSVGVEYLYDEREFNSRLRLGIIGRYRMFSFVVNYGSDWETHGVNTRAVYNLVGNRLQIGCESINEDIGPRIDIRINLGSKRVKLAHLYGSYVGTEFRYGLRIDFAQWFPVWDRKIKKIGNDLNPFESIDE